MKKKKILSLILLTAMLAVFSGCGCKQNTTPTYKMELEIWGSIDDSDVYNTIFDNYKKINKNIGNINYKKLTVDTYKKDLIDALASGQGPDIFLINNTWLPSFTDKVVPAPTQILNEQKMKSDFVDVVPNDFIVNGTVFGVPLSVDSLALYYNKDLFNQAGITSPPETWQEFSADVQKLTRVDNNGNIIISGAALGTAYNINRSTDVLNLLMLQNGVEMIDKVSKRASFDEAGKLGNNINFPGENALNFYTSFARIGSSNYSWNPSMHYSIDAFAEGKTAMMLNYSWQMGSISRKSPNLNFAVAPIPQYPDKPKVNYASYWSYVVTKNKISKNTLDTTGKAVIPQDTRVFEAWKFLRYLTTRPDKDVNVQYGNAGNAGKAVIDPAYDPAKEYISKTGNPSGRRDLIEVQRNDAKIGVFAIQNLLAKSWYQIDPESIEAIFADMINQVNRGQSSAREALRSAANKVNGLIVK